MFSKTFFTTTFSLLTLLLFAIGCTPAPNEPAVIDPGGLPAENGVVSGSVTVRNLTDSIDLPEGSIITVSLQDVSLADAASIVIGERKYKETQLPLAYEIKYELEAITESNSYSVSASVTDAAGNLLFTSDTHHPALTEGAGNEVDVELILVEQTMIQEDSDVESGSTVIEEKSSVETGLLDNALLEGTSWKLRTFSLIDESREVAAGSQITLNFIEGQANGSAGCNSYFGDYTNKDGTFSIGPVGATRMMCEENIMDQESLFLTALTEAQSFSLDENGLKLQLGDGAELVFDFNSQ